jgi:hypothetical protein
VIVFGDGDPFKIPADFNPDQVLNNCRADFVRLISSELLTREAKQCIMPTRYPRPPPSFQRLNSLNIVRSEIFNTVYNPKAERLGNKILKKRFRAQAMQDYYPMNFKFTPRVLGRMFPGLQFQDDYREDWEEVIEEYSLDGIVG